MSLDIFFMYESYYIEFKAANIPFSPKILQDFIVNITVTISHHKLYIVFLQDISDILVIITLQKYQISHIS